ncbi:hypothetical protein RYX36_000461 [Vicia faba]
MCGSNSLSSNQTGGYLNLFRLNDDFVRLPQHHLSSNFSNRPRSGNQNHEITSHTMDSKCLKLHKKGVCSNYLPDSVRHFFKVINVTRNPKVWRFSNTAPLATTSILLRWCRRSRKLLLLLLHRLLYRVQAAAMALVQHPVVNATYKDGKNFHYNSNINVAVAVAINGVLITPVLQDADKLDLYLLSQKWKELVAKARSKQLQPHEYNSGTFTLSNLGMFGVDRFDAILPPGQETPNTLPSSHFLPPPTLTEVIDETEIETETDAVLADADTTETSPLSEFLATNDEYPSPEARKSLLQQKLDLGEDEEALKILKHLMLSRLKLLKPWMC